MPTEPVQQLLEQGQRSGLFSAAGTRDLIAQFTADRQLTADQAAALLVEKKVLTAYQAEQLLAGHAEECVVAGRYRIVEKLGAGGMGTVYKAHDTNLGRLVAIKVLPARVANDPGAVARFQREAKALATVSHPGIVQAHDAGEDRGRQFLVMEYVEGTNLGRLLNEQGRVPPTLAADYVHQAAEALAHAHARGLVHRDLKPSNLLLTPERQIKILDLGLARFLQDQIGEAGLTREGAGLGTPDYMAPEQFGDARHVDPRADIYSLGCTLYHLLTGQVPFPGSSLTEKAQAHEEQAPPPIAVRCPEAPAGLVFVVQRMLAKRPADRFQTAGELAEALGPYVASSSASLPRLQRTTSWQGSQLSFTVPRPPRRRRRWALAGVASVALLALALALYFGPGLFRRAESSSGNDAAAPAQPEVVTIPNGFTVAKNGTGQFTTIGQALANVNRPGTTILILDDAVYREVVHIQNRRLHEGLTLESPHRATVEFPRDARIGLLIFNVPRVTVRGLNLHANVQVACVGVGALSPGVVLDSLRCYSDSPVSTTGLDLDGLTLSGEDEPVLIQNCTIAGFGNGFEVIGVNVATKTSTPCRRLLIRNNRIEDCIVAIWTLGRITDTHIVGNRVCNCAEASIRFDNLHEGSARILVANNSIQGPRRCVQVLGPMRGVAVEIRNNVLIADAGPDMVRDGGEPGMPAPWRIDHNWRQVRPPAADSPEAREWLPSAQDKVVERLPLVSLDSKHPDFFRPIKDSVLGTGGAGGDLPNYVGAVPPEGIEPWDWSKTWKARAGKPEQGEDKAGKNSAKSPGEKRKRGP
jgi:serine/threonine-protein kinase